MRRPTTSNVIFEQLPQSHGLRIRDGGVRMIAIQLHHPFVQPHMGEMDRRISPALGRDFSPS